MKAIKGNQMPRANKPAAQPEPPKSHLLHIKERPGVAPDRQMADVLTDGVASNASTLVAFTKVTMPDTSLTELVNSLADQGKRVNANDFSQQEHMLNAQANALNAIAGEMFRRAASNMGEYPEAMERYMRLGLKAQSQCRVTLESLAAMKNPPVVYAKQANIAHGPQQVNNGGQGFSDAITPARAHGKTESEQTKLLEGDRNGSAYLDTGAAATSAGGNPAMEAVGAVHRPAQRGRKGDGRP